MFDVCAIDMEKYLKIGTGESKGLKGWERLLPPAHS